VCEFSDKTEKVQTFLKQIYNQWRAAPDKVYRHLKTASDRKKSAFIFVRKNIHISYRHSLKKTS
jgi:hypothetical protein